MHARQVLAGPLPDEPDHGDELADVAEPGMRILALLANAEEDEGNEWIKLKSFSGAAVNLSGWRLVDDGGH